MTKIETDYDPDELRKDIIREAKTIGMQEGFASAIADQVTASISAWLESKPIITRRDLNRKIAENLKKYHSDLAYLYENRDKII